MKKILGIGAPLVLVLLGMFPVFRPLVEVPGHFPEPVYDLQGDQHNGDRNLLGRALFYDPILSADSSISCASCHSPYNAFAHTDHALSHGIGDSIGRRNAPALFNLAWSNSLMWDGASHHLEVQALAPITHPGEMAENLNRLMLKLRRSRLYPSLFERAFGEDTITAARMLKALAAFQMGLVSATSRYDSMRLGAVAYTEMEAKGYELYLQHCSQCHREPLFTNQEFAGNGLPVDTLLDDRGRMEISLDPADSLHFRVPSLRNLSYTYPYMHDGRFRQLSEVLDHYSTEIVRSPALSAPLQGPLQLSADEKTELTAFLLTLNDPAFVFDRSHQFPMDLFFKSP